MSTRIFNEPIDALVYFADCAIASYAEAMMVKKYSGADRRRLLSIAESMIANVGHFLGTGSPEFMKLVERLAKSKGEDKVSKSTNAAELGT